MLNIIESRRPAGSVPIEKIEMDTKSRDDIPALLIGLQEIYVNEATRTELCRLLDEHILQSARRDIDRQEMDVWAILVMGVLKQGLLWDDHRLEDFVNHHRTIRKMLGHDILDESEYEFQTIRKNVERVPPELLREVGRLVAETGHKVARKFAWRDVRRAS